MPNEKGEITKEEFDYSGFFADVFKAGRNIVSDGERGGGKTHTAIAIAEMMMSRRFPFDRFPKTFLLTNVIFMRKDGGSEDDYYFKVIFSRNNAEIAPRTKDKQIESIIAFISDGHGCAYAEIADRTNIPLSSVKRLMAELQNEGRIEKTGKQRSSGWKINH